MSAPHAAPVWIFDLDDTLHNASAHIFPHINRAMTAFMVERLNLSESAASQLRQHYWQRYGATLLGLMRHHQIAPEDFLHHTHQFPDLKSMLVLERGLHAMLRRLPGRKILFSNGPWQYSQAVLSLTGLREQFAAVYSVERVRFHPKPDTRGFRYLLQAEGLRPERCVMVEDSLANLATAKRLGMATIWISRTTRRPPWVDLRLPSVLALPRHYARFRLHTQPG